jgi:hypothetical protein
MRAGEFKLPRQLEEGLPEESPSGLASRGENQGVRLKIIPPWNRKSPSPGKEDETRRWMARPDQEGRAGRLGSCNLLLRLRCDDADLQIRLG